MEHISKSSVYTVTGENGYGFFVNEGKKRINILLCRLQHRIFFVVHHLRASGFSLPSHRQLGHRPTELQPAAAVVKCKK